MSNVTNLIISFSIAEDEISRAMDINSFFNNGRDFNIVSADFEKNKRLLLNTNKSWYGGDKYLETPLYIGAFNDLNVNELISFLKLIDWSEPENVQVIIKGQNDDKFSIISLL